MSQLYSRLRRLHRTRFNAFLFTTNSDHIYSTSRLLRRPQNVGPTAGPFETMASEQPAREQLLALLAHRPRNIITGMIKTSTTAPNYQLTRTPVVPLGNLDALPLELLHSILSMLDLQTLLNFTQTCLRGTAIVVSLVEFRDLVQHAPQAMRALASTKLLHYHPVHTLHAAMLSEECSSCGEYGAFLFLPTCERCCFSCLWRNQSLWVIPISQARRCFDLSIASTKKLPTMTSIPGEYCVLSRVSRQRKIRLVSVKAAKELAWKEKSAETLAQYREDIAAGLSKADKHLFRWLQAAPMTPPGPGFVTRQGLLPFVAQDKFCGMSSIPFPSRSTGRRVENGLWCLGCEKACREWCRDREIQKVARSEKAFFEHISHCRGARQLVPDVEEKLRQMRKT